MSLHLSSNEGGGGSKKKVYQVNRLDLLLTVDCTAALWVDLSDSVRQKFVPVLTVSMLSSIKDIVCHE